uniref:uncharacterized protein LOC131101995 n=1 Tax=Doryrhamphus excisus TaxID=161450 RepID=UPI0025AE6B73|nr:uncharacterized protein LOC131101995 [Doryrhamphus excisus]
MAAAAVTMWTRRGWCLQTSSSLRLLVLPVLLVLGQHVKASQSRNANGPLAGLRGSVLSGPSAAHYGPKYPAGVQHNLKPVLNTGGPRRSFGGWTDGYAPAGSVPFYRPDRQMPPKPTWILQRQRQGRPDTVDTKASPQHRPEATIVSSGGIQMVAALMPQTYKPKRPQLQNSRSFERRPVLMPQRYEKAARGLPRYEPKWPSNLVAPDEWKRRSRDVSWLPW